MTNALLGTEGNPRVINGILCRGLWVSVNCELILKVKNAREITQL